ncbi:MAG: bifunctional riboflavin kinase/FAD synthetase [Barnesiella sp.]
MKIIDSIQKISESSSVAAIGFFDGVHQGHRALINSVRQEAERANNTSAIVTFRTHPRQVLNSDCRFSLLTTTDEKLELLEKTGIDYAIVLDFTPEMSLLSAREFLQLLKENYNIQALFIGYDHRFGHNRKEGFEDYTAYGKELGVQIFKAEAFSMDKTNISSSIIRQLLETGNIKQANRFLSYRYAITGNVIDGFKLGRKLGFPTANISLLNTEKLIPAHGVYAVETVLPNGEVRDGILNIGNRPTLERQGDYSIECHIFDFTGDLYGKDLTVRFVSYLRPERKMNSLEELKAQLKEDKQNAILALSQKSIS